MHTQPETPTPAVPPDGLAVLGDIETRIDAAVRRPIEQARLAVAPLLEAIDAAAAAVVVLAQEHAPRLRAVQEACHRPHLTLADLRVLRHVEEARAHATAALALVASATAEAAQAHADVESLPEHPERIPSFALRVSEYARLVCAAPAGIAWELSQMEESLRWIAEHGASLPLATSASRTAAPRREATEGFGTAETSYDLFARES